MVLSGLGWPGRWHYGVTCDNDQSLEIDHLSNEGSGIVLRSDANFVGAMVYTTGSNSCLVHVKNSELSLQGAGNGVLALSGNTADVRDTIIQGFSQYATICENWANYNGCEEDNIYTEVGGATVNPFTPGGTGKGQAGYIGTGGVTPHSLKGVAEPLGNAPVFYNTGSTAITYWVVAHASGGSVSGVSTPLPAGFANTTLNSAVAISGYFPAVAPMNLGTVTYDILATTGVGGAFTIPYGASDGVHFLGAVTTGISGSCSYSGYCSFTDPQTGYASYTVATPTFYPELPFWPGDVIGPAANTINSANTALLNADFVPISGASPLVVVVGAQQPTIHSMFCVTFLEPATAMSLQCDLSPIQNGNLASHLIDARSSNALNATSAKGVLNLLTCGAPSDCLTLLDSTPLQTLSSVSRAAWGANDTAIGYDDTSGNYMDFRAKSGVDIIIGAVPTGSPAATNFQERTTALSKIFNVPVTINGNLTVTGTCTGCGSGSGGGSGTVNSGTATQLAMYSANGAAVSGDSGLTDSGSTLNYTGSNGITAAAGTFSGNVTVNGQLLVAGPWMVSSPIPGTAMAAAGAGTSTLGISNDGNFYISANAGTPQKVATTATSSYFSNLFQEDANDLGEYNGATAQGLNIYGTRADASDYERLTLTYDTVNTGYFKLDAQAIGTGVKRGLAFWVNGAARWGIDQVDMFKPFEDNAYDVGSSTFRVRNGYFGTGVMTPSLTLNGAALTSLIGTPSANLMTAGTVSGTGAPLCTDGTGNLTITTVGCPPGTGTLGGSGTTPQFAYWTNTNGLGAAPLFVTSANTVEQYNGSSVQTFNVYGTFPSAGNYERLALTYDTVNTSYFKIDAQAGGTGTKRGLAFWVNGAARWGIDQLDMLKPIVDNAYDFGTSTLRVRDFYLARNLIMSGSATSYNGKTTAGTGLGPIYGTASLTGQTAAISSTTLCASTTCGAGQYIVNYYVDSTLACTTAGSAAATVTISWTDETNARTLQVPLSGTGVSGGNSLSLGNTANFASGDISLWSAGSANLAYSTSYTGCTTGTGMYALRMAVRQVQ